MDKPKWSVLLKYPDYICSDETYYTWVNADTVDDAVKVAQNQAIIANAFDYDMPLDDFAVLLVTKGHIPAEIRQGVN